MLITKTFIGILFILSVFTFLMLRRNYWVYKNQTKLINNPHKLEYLSYGMMMLKFWIWDIEKLKRKKL